MSCWQKINNIKLPLDEIIEVYRNARLYFAHRCDKGYLIHERLINVFPDKAEEKCIVLNEKEFHEWIAGAYWRYFHRPEV